MTPPPLYPYRYLRTWEELRHVAAEPPPFEDYDMIFDPPSGCSQAGGVCTKCLAYLSAAIEYIGSLTTNN